MKRLVIYRLGSLGDTVITLPFFNRVAELYPNHERVLLTNVAVSSNAAPLLSVLGKGRLVHDAIAYPVGLRSPRKLLELRAQLRTLGADTMIYMMPKRGALNVWRDFLFFKTCGFKKIIGVPFSRDLDCPRVDPVTEEMEPEVERIGRMLAELGPIDLHDPRNWDLWLDDDEIASASVILAVFAGRPFIAINTGGKLAKNDWGHPNWLDLIARLTRAHPSLGLLGVGSKEDRPRFLELASVWAGPTVNACGELNPRQSAAALRRATIFIGHDSGPMHLASAMGVSCIGLFGDNNPPRMWHPYLGDNRVLHDMRGVKAISVDQVAGAFDDLAGLKRPA